MNDPANHQRLKWHLYEIKKRKLRSENLTSDQYDHELAKIIKELKI